MMASNRPPFLLSDDTKQKKIIQSRKKISDKRNNKTFFPGCSKLVRFPLSNPKVILLRLVYIGEFCVRFRIKLARFVKKISITKRASLVQNRLRYRANVNDPL